MDVLKNIFRVLKNGWMKFAYAVGWFNTRLLLSILYFTVIAVPSIVLRIFKKDLLDRKIDLSAKSYWNSKSAVVHSVENAKHQF